MRLYTLHRHGIARSDPEWWAIPMAWCGIVPSRTDTQSSINYWRRSLLLWDGYIPFAVDYNDLSIMMERSLKSSSPSCAQISSKHFYFLIFIGIQRCKTSFIFPHYHIILIANPINQDCINQSLTSSERWNLSWQI